MVNMYCYDTFHNAVLKDI